MHREYLKSRGLAVICATALAFGAAACGETESPADRGAMDRSESPTQDPAYGAGQQEARQTGRQARATGCLQRGEVAGTFVLTQARLEGEAGSVGTTGSTTAAGTEQFRLVDTGNADLSEHVGNRVIVTGRLQTSMSGAETGAQPGGGAPTGDTSPRDDLGADARGGGTEGTAGTGAQIIVENVERAEGTCPRS